MFDIFTRTNQFSENEFEIELVITPLNKMVVTFELLIIFKPIKRQANHLTFV
ncbi:MAG: hypothetical protein BAJATHORv1_60147 [Candidatus Thorarchaeota archaeon]|nr:MAG: hypothetical protein BAJATHORv1_60147 [Candidatus Thorarchaeota archaeon]